MSRESISLKRLNHDALVRRKGNAAMRKWVWKRGVEWLGLGAVVLTLGCGGGSGANSQVRVMNASPGESSLAFLVNNSTLSANVGYGTASSYTPLNPGSPTLTVQTPGSTTALISQNETFVANLPNTMVVTGYAPNVSLLHFDDDNSPPASGNVKLRFIHAAPTLGTCDVYVVAPGTDLTTVNPSVIGLSFENESNYMSVAAGSYEIEFTLTGQKVAMIDTGSITLSAGEVRSIVGIVGTGTDYAASILSDVN